MRVGWIGLLLLGVLVALWLLGALEPEAPAVSDAGHDASEAEAPTLATTVRARPTEGPLDGAALLVSLRGLDKGALGPRLQQLWQPATRRAVSYDPALVAYLITLLTDEERVTAYGALALLGTIGPRAIDDIRPLASHADRRLRMAAVGIFARWASGGHRLAAPDWIALFDDADKQVATYAWNVASMGLPYDEALADDIQSRMRSGPQAGYYSAERALARMGPEGLARLFAILETPDTPFDLNILSALRMARPEELRPFLPRLEPWIRAHAEDRQVLALQVLHAFEGETTVLMPAMLEAWRHESFAVRLELLGLFERMGPKAAPAVEQMLEAMEESDERISSRAMNILGLTRAQPARVLPKLRAALDELGDDPAAIAIGQYGAAAEPYLRSALQSPDEDVRYFALAGVYRMGAASARLRDLVQPLITIDDEEVAHRASMAMGAMGAEAEEALPLIWARYVQGKMHVQQAAEIFWRVGPPAQAFLLAGLEEQDRRAKVLQVLENFPSGTDFAFAALASRLRSEDVRERLQALLIVQRALAPPPGPPGMGWDDREHYLAPQATRDATRRIFTAALQDPDRNTRHQAQTGLDWLAEMESPEER